MILNLMILGILLFSATFKSNDEDVNAMFTTDGTGRDTFRTVMSKERFQIIFITLRFDDFSTRDERKLANVAAAVSEIFEIFVSVYRIMPLTRTTPYTNSDTNSSTAQRKK